jgi:SAM-dependent methyltransferase
MSQLAERLRDRYYEDAEHPYRIFEAEVRHRLQPASVLLDVGCGREAPILRRFRGHASRLIGIDLVEFRNEVPGVELVQGDMGQTGLPPGSVDVVMARSVMEHVTDPEGAYAEMERILKPGGAFIFLTANLWDYASLLALAIPNRFHPWLVAKTEGRAEEDVFPTAYRSNTRRSVHRLARKAGLDVERFDYLSQYPNYFMFNGALFLVATGYEKLISNVPGLGFLKGWLLVTLVKPSGAPVANVRTHQ